MCIKFIEFWGLLLLIINSVALTFSEKPYTNDLEATKKGFLYQTSINFLIKSVFHGRYTTTKKNKRHIENWQSLLI